MNDKRFLQMPLDYLPEEFNSDASRDGLALGDPRVAVTVDLVPVGFLVPWSDVEQDAVDYRWEIRHRNFQDLLSQDPQLLFESNPGIDCFVLDLAPVSGVVAWVNPRLAAHLPIPTSPVARVVLEARFGGAS